MTDRVLKLATFALSAGVLLAGGAVFTLVYRIQINNQQVEEIMKSIPVHPDLIFFSRQTTGYPDAKPALIYSYRIKGKDNHESIRDFYLKELKESGWQLKDTVMINSSKDYSLDYFETALYEKIYKLTLRVSYESAGFILSRY